MKRKIILLKSFLSAVLLVAGLVVIHSCSKTEIKQPGTEKTSFAVANATLSLSETTIGTLRVVTAAGNSTSGYVEGATITAQFKSPNGIAFDSAGNAYIADMTNHVIRKMTNAGVVSTLAGSGVAGFSEGTGTAAQFRNPSGVAVDASGNVYVADKGNHVIRKITPLGEVTTLAGAPGSFGYSNGAGSSARFSSPAGIAIDASGNLLVADSGNHVIRRVTTAGFVSLLAGTPNSQGGADGSNAFAEFNGPVAVVVDASNAVYVADAGNNKIRKISGGVVSTLAGGGTAGDTPGFVNATGTNARFTNPTGITVDNAGNVFVADKGNHAIRQVTAAGVVTTVAGNGTAGFMDGVPSVALFNAPAGIAIDRSGNIFVADQNNYRIREIGVITTVSTLAGNGSAALVDGVGTNASFYAPLGIATDASGNLYVGDSYNHSIRKITPAGVVTTVAGITFGPLSGAYADGPVNVARFNSPNGVVLDASGNIYVADQGNQRIRKISTSGIVSTIAGNGNAGYAEGTGTTAMFDHPAGIGIDAAGNLYVADYYNHRIRKITPAGVVSTLAGTGIGNTTGGYADGPGNVAKFNYPAGIATDALGNVYVADVSNNRIRKVAPDGTVSTLAGSGAKGLVDGPSNVAQFSSPSGVKLDAAGNIYVADQGNNRIRKITPAGVVSTVAGATGSGFLGTGFLDGPGNVAQFSFPGDVVVGVNGSLYVTDIWNNRIRRIQ